MGSSGLVTKDREKVEYTSLTQLFEEQCPIYMSYGMTYDEYWFGEPYRTKFYRDAFKLKQKRMDEQLWLQGMYIYEALCDVSPVLHAFSKSGTKPLPYPKVPWGMEEYEKKLEEKERNKEPTAQEVENERLKAQIFFSNWARDTKKQFQKEG